ALHDHARAFFEATYSNRKSDQQLAPEPLFTFGLLTVSEDNVYNPFGRDFIDVRRRMVEAGSRRTIQDVHTFRLVTGLDGRLPEGLPALQGWRWSLAFNYGRTEAKQIAEGNLMRSRLRAALGPSFMGGADGMTPTCGTPTAPIPGCVPLDLFHGIGTITQPMLDYVTFTGTDSGFNQQQIVQLNVTGRLFEIPGGGDAALALGAEYRDESGADLPNPLITLDETTGNTRDAVEGGYDVREGYAEVSVVPLLGRTGAEWVELNAAIRAFDSDPFGADFTWKAGGLWRIGQGVAVRGTYSTAFRAPTIASLYSGQADDFAAVSDPCDTRPRPRAGDRDGDGVPDDQDMFPDDPRTMNQRRNCGELGVPDTHADDRAQLRSLIGGNPKLTPETANIVTAGVVYEPKLAPGLSFTLDYFDVEIDDAIQSLGAPLILQSCYDADEDQRKYCDKIQRDPVTNQIDLIVDTLTNVGGNDTAGLDFNVSYRQNTQLGAFHFDVEGTWLRKFDSIEADGSVLVGKGVYDLGVYPAWRFNFGTLWGLHPWGAGMNLRYIGAFRECDDNNCKLGTRPNGDPLQDPTMSAPLTRTVPDHVTSDVFASYTLETPAGTTRLTLGVNNVLDQPPAILYNGFLGTSDASTYDFMGRYFYARLVQQF
ncbi:MAG TPA: TonB-dependent receptor, partial [Haliangium sp.]|nr:TonB-dependent receptor [Haliangium sp.]